MYRSHKLYRVLYWRDGLQVYVVKSILEVEALPIFFNFIGEVIFIKGSLYVGHLYLSAGHVSLVSPVSLDV